MSPRIAIAFAALVAFAGPALAEEEAIFETTLKGTAFNPSEIKVPAGKPFKIKMHNANAAPAELEGHELEIEKVAAGGTSITVRVKALEPGTYLFVDEFQEDVAKGYVIAE